MDETTEILHIFLQKEFEMAILDSECSLLDCAHAQVENKCKRQINVQ